MRKETSSPDFVGIEHSLLEKWKSTNLFAKIVAKNENGPRFRFLDGPVTANNRLGIHHIWGRTLKDITIKYNAMIGKSCQYQNGFDAQGMWVEVNVEKELGLNGKPEIVGHRRMGVILATAESTEEAIRKADRAYDALQIEVLPR